MSFNFSNLVTTVWHKIIGFFQQDVVPEATTILKAFEAQFLTPGGQLIFNAVTAFFSALTPGESVSDIEATGKTILSGLGTQELDLAGADASQVVLDAIRVHLSAANNAGTSAANPAATVAAGAAGADTSGEGETSTSGAQDEETDTETETQAPAGEGAAAEGENAASGA